MVQHACMLVIASVCAMIAGCHELSEIPDVPFVEPDGRVHGGHPKVRALIAAIEPAARERWRNLDKFSHITYAGAITTGGRAGYIYGTIPTDDGEASIDFHIACDATTIDSATEATLTEIVTWKEARKTFAETVRFQWNGKTWNRMFIIGLPAEPDGPRVIFDVAFRSLNHSTTGEGAILVFDIRSTSPKLPEAPTKLIVTHVVRSGYELPEKGDRMMFEIPLAAIKCDAELKHCDVLDRYVDQLHVVPR